MRVLGIDVDVDQVRRWSQLLAPAWQPFFVEPDDGFESPPTSGARTLTDDLRCTFTTWRVRDASAVVWFDEASFLALSRAERAALVRSQVARRRGAVPSVRRWMRHFDVVRLRAQADGHRFVWWPSLLDENPEPALRDRIEDGQLATRHAEVTAATWERCAAVVPGARSIVGRFPPSSGPNCFGATLAAAGRAVADARVLQDEVETFLSSCCVRGGRDDDPGTVLIWRDRDGLPFHSAITIGAGWAIEKPAETWWTPTIVAATVDLVRVNRAPGLRLERHRLV